MKCEAQAVADPMKLARHAAEKRPRLIKADLHLHSCEDPKDVVKHSAMELLHRAHEKGFRAIAITLHDHVLTQPELFAHAKKLGILLLPAAEMRIEGGDVVLLNVNESEASSLRSFEDLALLKQRRGDSILVFAPHPFYVLGGSIGRRRLETHIHTFDAIEYCHFHTAGWNLNAAALDMAAQHSKPLLATSDTHRLDFFGEHYSLIEIDGELTPEALFGSIRAGRVHLISPAWKRSEIARYLFYILVTHPIQSLIEKLSR